MGKAGSLSKSRSESSPEHPSVGEVAERQSRPEGSAGGVPPAEPLPLGEPPADAAAASETVVPEEEPTPPPKLWTGSFELGLDGSEGNSESFSFRFGFDAKRKTDCNVLTFDLDYRKKTTKDVETASRAFFDWRHEWLFQDSSWTSFIHGTVDYDEFQAFDVRATVDLGAGYQFVKSETTSFGGRFGSGFSHEIGGPEDTYVPEAVFGLDFEHRFNDRHKLTATAEYTPDMTGWKDFRIKSRASWEALIDKEMNLSLKLSVLERHDSTPHGSQPNDLDYSAVLLWKF